MNETDIHTFLNSLTKEQLVSFLENEVRQHPVLLQDLHNFLETPAQIESIPQELDFTPSVTKQSSSQEKISLFHSLFVREPMYLHFAGRMKKQEQADILRFVQINGFRANVI